MFGMATGLVNQMHRLASTYGHQLTNIVAPATCVLCGGPGQPAGQGPSPGSWSALWRGLWGLDLCLHCEAACRPAPPQPDPPPGIHRLRALFLYAPPADQLVQRLKFQHQLAPARVLGMLMARAWHGDLACEAPGAASGTVPVLVPIPLHAARLRERGFNQSLETGRHLAPRLGLPLQPGLLLRRRHTEAQSGLAAAARRRNIDAAFAVVPRGGTVPPAHVILLDDVLTTGATVSAAAAALRVAGCRRVDCWVATRTP